MSNLQNDESVVVGSSSISSVIQSASDDLEHSTECGSSVVVSVPTPAIGPPSNLREAIENYGKKDYLKKYFSVEQNEIGSGAFGSVFKASYKPIGPLTDLSSPFAIKKIDLHKLGSGRELDFHINSTIWADLFVKVFDF